MTLTQLEYVLAVYKFKHFGKAAESCFVTQPTLSMQLQKLEDELQVTIFDRSKSPIKPTSDGMIVIEQALKIIKEQKKLIALVEESKDEVSGEFSLSVIPTLAPFILPLFVHEFVKKYPRVKLKISENKTEDVIDMLKNDEVDAGLLVTPLFEKSIHERVLYYEPFYLFTSADHPFAKKDKIKQEELDINDIWLLNKGHCFRDQVIKICSQRSSLNNSAINFESGNFETLKNMVLKSNGYTLLPHMAISDLPKKYQKLVKPFQKPIPTREVALVHNKSLSKQKLLNLIEEEILSMVPDELIEFNPKSHQVVDIK